MLLRPVVTDALSLAQAGRRRCLAVKLSHLGSELGMYIPAAAPFPSGTAWGPDASQTFSVFLAYYLREGTFTNASPIGYAFVGGLSISVGT